MVAFLAESLMSFMPIQSATRVEGPFGMMGEG